MVLVRKNVCRDDNLFMDFSNEEKMGDFCTLNVKTSME